MRKPYFIFSIIFFAASFVFLYFSPVSKTIYETVINSSDLLFPFSVYQGMLNPASRSDWVFGGYTPFIELIIGLFIWLSARNIPLALVVYAVLQPIMVALSLIYLAYSIFGKNWKLFSLILFFLSGSIVIFSTGHLNFYFFLFPWYMHITTACLSIIALGALIQFLMSDPLQWRSWVKPLLLLCSVSVIGTLSDALFLSQFVAPAVVLVVGLGLGSIIPFRRTALAILCVLYSTALGLALFRIPTLWGSDRIAINGFYMRSGLDLILTNIPNVLNNLMNALEGNLFFDGVWISFYVLCLTSIVIMIQKRLINRQGTIRKKIIATLTFFPLQMMITLCANLVSVEPALRYILPAVFIPLFLGWPFLIMSQPILVKFLRGRVPMTTGAALLGIPLAFFAFQAYTSNRSVNITEHYPDYVRCLDENAPLFGLRNGIAQYWLARPITLFSRAGLVVVQVTPNLTPYPILNNSEGYDRDFDFIIIDGEPLNGDPKNGHWIKKELVLNRFGEPSSFFTCAGNEILVYNRVSDDSFRNPFQDAGFTN